MLKSNQPDNRPVSPNPDSDIKNLPRPQRIAVWLLAILAILIAAGWVWQMRSQIKRPFSYSGNNSGMNKAAETDYLNVLKNHDTDNDGLFDYDEIYVHKTSPYLEDTDSDGLTDKQEIEEGTDPTCPKGKNCGTATESATSSGDATSGVTFPETTDTENLNSAGIEETILQSALSGQIDVAVLRQLLLQSGADAETLNKISDEDLMKSYQETLNSQNEQ